MRLTISNSLIGPIRFMLATAILTGGANLLQAQILIPGSGQHVPEAGDDFEDEKWEYTYNLPKSSRNLDKHERQPTGFSNNGRWFESPKRGQPDCVRRVPTPPGGITGSKGSLRLQSRDTGIPGFTSSKSQQDDLLLDVSGKVGLVPVSFNPSCVVRVYMPPFEQWDNNTDVSFGVRAGVQGLGWDTSDKEKKRRKRFSFIKRSRKKAIEPYWPGIFVQFNSETDANVEADSAYFIIRCDESGRDLIGPQIKETGWWTLGMSFTRDGRVHYFIRKGVGNLTMQDHVASHFPYSSVCQHFNTFFFNIISENNSRDWSTKWIIDDPSFYWVR